MRGDAGDCAAAFCSEEAARASRGLWVSEALRDDIQEGRYAPGDRVTELEVAERLGVSRPCFARR